MLMYLHVIYFKFNCGFQTLQTISIYMWIANLFIMLVVVIVLLYCTPKRIHHILCHIGTIVQYSIPT